MEKKSCKNCKHAFANSGKYCYRDCGIYYNKFEPVFKPLYEIIKPISGKILIERNLTKQSSIDKFIKEFGYYNEIEWTEEVEDWCIENNWIYHFEHTLKRIKKIEYEPEFDESKYHCFKGASGTIYTIIETDGNIFQWIPINKKSNAWTGEYTTAFEAWNEVMSFEKHSFNSLKEVAEYYNL